MSSFKIDISSLREENKLFYEKYNDLKVEQETLLKVTLTVDGSWNDNNTPVFIECVEKDLHDLEKYHHVVLSSSKEIENFTNSLDSILKSGGIMDVKKNLGYDEGSCNTSIRLIDDSVSDLNRMRSMISSAYVSCDAANMISGVNNAIARISSQLKSIGNNMEMMRKGIEESVSSTSSAINALDFVDIKDNGLKYDWEPISVIRNHLDTYNNNNVEELNANENILTPELVEQAKIASSATLKGNSEGLKEFNQEVNIRSVNDYSSNRASVIVKGTEISYNSADKVSGDATVIDDATYAGGVIPKEENYSNTSSNLVGNIPASFTSETTSTYDSGMNNLNTMAKTSKVETLNEDYETTNSKNMKVESTNVSELKADRYEGNGSTMNRTNSSMVLNEISKEEYQTHASSNFSAGTAMGSIDSLKVESYDSGGGGFSNSSSMGNLNLEKPTYEEATIGFNSNIKTNVSLESNSPYED